MQYISVSESRQKHQLICRQSVIMKYTLVLVILAAVAAELVLAQNGDHPSPPGGDHGKPGEPKPKLALHRLRRQIPAGGGSGQMGGGGSVDFSAGGKAGGTGAANGDAGAQGGASEQFGGQASFGGGASGGGGAGLNGKFGARAQGQV